MVIFHHEHPQNSSMRCSFLFSLLKDAFSTCRVPMSSSIDDEEEEDDSPIDEINDAEEIVSTIITRAMEAKFKRKRIIINPEFSSIFHPSVGELFTTTSMLQGIEANDDNGKKQQQSEVDMQRQQNDDFQSFASNCSAAASATSEFLSARRSFSVSSSWKGMDLFPEIQSRRPVMQLLGHCEGWPFGLCRRALLLPPLPESPSESWSWCKGTKIVKAY